MKIKQNISKEFLLDQYVQQKKSICRIAKEIGRSENCIKYNLSKYEIPIRKFNKPMFAKELLLEEYIIKQKSARQIANETGTRHDVILSMLKKYNIPRRSCSRLGRPNVSTRGRQIKKGERFGKLIAMNRIETKQASLEKWECLCDCGKTTIAKSRELKRNRIKSCGCLKDIKYEGYEGISGNLFGRYKRGAKVRGILFEITPKNMWEIFIAQKGKCSISGVLLDLDKNNRTASLDRIDSSKNYTIDNIQWIHKTINTMKWDLPHDQFIEWCKKITQHQKRTS